MYILGIIVLGNSINQPLFWYSKWQCSFSFLSQHVTVFFSGKTCSWKPYSTMVTIYVSCNYLSQFLTVHCVTNYGNTQCFPVNNPWNQSIDFLTKETCCLMVSAILPIWYIHGRYGRILYIYIWYIHWYYQYTTPIQYWGCWSEWRRKLRSLARSLGDGSLSWRARCHLGHFRTIYI